MYYSKIVVHTLYSLNFALEIVWEQQRETSDLFKQQLFVDYYSAHESQEATSSQAESQVAWTLRWRSQKK